MIKGLYVGDLCGKQVRVSKKYLKANGKSVVLDNIRKPKGVGLKLMSDYTNT